MASQATTGPHITARTNAGGDLIFENTGAVADYTDPHPRILYPGDTAVLSGGAWLDRTLDRTAEITATTSLAVLKADGTDGDGFFGGGAFTSGQHVLLDDDSLAYYDGAAWQAGVAP